MHLIFDLDGTLVDSKPGVFRSLEIAISQRLPEIDFATLSFKIGPPVLEMLRESLKVATEVELIQLEVAFRTEYDDNGWKLTTVYSSVRETLIELTQCGFFCHVVTNKPALATARILAHLGISNYFCEVISPDSLQPKFTSKAGMLNYLLEKHGISASDAIYIGDLPDDYSAAEQCGVGFVGVKYGYGMQLLNELCPLSVSSFDELLVLLKRTNSYSGWSKFMINRDIFEDLFVLELANNHWGDVNRGLRIIHEFGTVVRYNDVRAAIKLQFRAVDNFIHKDFRDRQDIRYIKKTIDTRMSREDLAAMVEAVRRANCVRLATPFDEKSVELCMELGIEIIKIASSDVTDWPLLEKIAKTRKPVLVSTGGTSLTDIDNMVTFFENRNIPLAINHCVSLYPSEDADLQLNQIDFLKHRYPGHVIGLSTHEYHDWRSSILVAYAKGARTFERHIDIQMDGKPISPYCSTPEQVAAWFQAFKKAREMCGAPGIEKAPSSQKEVDYLTSLVRGVYARRDMSTGHILTQDDYYLAIPLQKGQLSCRELLNDQVLAQDCVANAPLMVEMVDSLYNRDETLRKQLYSRGL